MPNIIFTSSAKLNCEAVKFLTKVYALCLITLNQTGTFPTTIAFASKKKVQMVQYKMSSYLWCYQSSLSPKDPSCSSIFCLFLTIFPSLEIR